jgi:hypothetical protein
MCRSKALIPPLFCLILAYSSVYGQYRWTDLKGPYWASGIDVACGTMDNATPDPNHLWYRYLVGSNGNEIRPFYWNANSTKWLPADNPLPAANKIISYNGSRYGDYAVCSAYGDDIYLSEDGGATWGPLHFGDYFDTNHFSAIEVLYHTDHPSDMIFVGTEAYRDQATTYIYHNLGGQLRWDPLGQADGNDPMFGLPVNDIECDHYGRLFAGTAQGIFMHDPGSQYANPWTLVNFGGDNIPALENVLGPESEQIASVLHNDSYSLWLSPNNDHWSDPDEILLDSQHFDKEVRDLAAVKWDSPISMVSCYAATSEGLYLIYFDDSSPSTADAAIDIKTIPTAYGFYPMQYDKDVVAVDFHYDSVQKIVTTLAATTHSVYEITEVRDIKDGQLISLNVKEAVAGTYFVHAADSARAYQGR